MGVRLPTILGKAIEDVYRTVNEQVRSSRLPDCADRVESDEERITDLLDCIHRMDDLMKDLSSNSAFDHSVSTLTLAGKLRPILDDGEGDVALWNKEIAKYFRGARANDSLSMSHARQARTS